MSEVVTIIRRTIDLDQTIVKETLFTLFATEDAQAHRFELTLERGGQAIDLTGHGVAAYYTPKGVSAENSIPIVGKIESGKAVITLPDTCYNHAGPFALVIKVTKGEDRKAVYVCESSMLRSHTDEFSDEGNVLNIDELLAKIADMEAATAAGLAAAQEARDAGEEAVAAAQTVQSIYEVKADAIMDESSKAASHELHAQGGPLEVTLYGNTTETGSGTKSPDNPYTIRGVGTGHVHAGGKNLVNVEDKTFSKSNVYFETISLGLDAKPGTTYTFSADVASNVTPFNISIGIGDKTAYKRDISNKDNNSSGRISLTFTVSENLAAQFGTLLQLRAPRYSTPTTYEATVKNIQLEVGSTATAYEPYNANVINVPLLPDDSPLMGNGTVMDTVENDVLSGCDKKITFDGSDDEPFVLTGTNTAGVYRFQHPAFSGMTPASVMYTNYLKQVPAGTNGTYMCVEGISVDGNNNVHLFIKGVNDGQALRTLLSANPLTVYYRSSEYTPDKDLRVCKVTRKWESFDLSDYEFGMYGNAAEPINGVCYLYKYSNDFTNIKSVKGMVCNMLTPYANTSSGQGTDVIGAYAQGKYLYVGVKAERLDGYAAFNPNDNTTWSAAFNAWLSENPIVLYNKMDTPEVYMTDLRLLRKPSGIMPVTVTGSGETSVEYPHDTKHYIDSKISEIVTLALANG